MKRSHLIYAFTALSTFSIVSVQAQIAEKQFSPHTTSYAQAIILGGSPSGFLYAYPDLNKKHRTDQLSEEEDLALPAHALFSLGHKAAREALERALTWQSLRPGRSSLHMELATLHLYNNRFTQALRELSLVEPKALSSTRETEWMVKQGYALERINPHQPRTRQLFESAARRNNEWGQMARLYLAAILLSEQQVEEAERYYLQLSKVPTLSSDARAGLAAIHYYKGNYQQAVQTIEEIEQTTGNGDTDSPLQLYVAGNAYYRLQQPERALRYLEALKQKNSQEMLPEDYLLLGASYMELNRMEEAVPPLLQATFGDAQTAGAAHLYLGRARRELNLYNEAIASFEAASDGRYPSSIREQAMYEMALLLRSSGQGVLGQEIRITETFLNEFPQSKYSSAMMQFLQEFYLSNQDYAKSLVSIGRINKPGEQILVAKKFVLNRLALQQLQEGKISEARNFIAQSSQIPVRDEQFDKELLLIRADINFRLWEYTEVVRDLQSYLYSTSGTNPANEPLVHYNLGYALFNLHKYEEALKQFFLAAPRSELSRRVQADAFARQGDCCYMSSRFDEAARSYRSAYEIDPDNNVYALYKLADIEGLRKNYIQQVASLSDLIKKHPESSYVPAALFEAGRAYVFLNQTQQAEVNFTTLMQKYPQTEYGRIGALQLALSHYNSGNTQKAIDTYLKVIKEAPQSDEARLAFNSLKSIYVEEGRSDEFIDLAKQLGGSFELKSDESRTLSFKSVEQAYFNRTKAAPAQLQAFVDKNPNTHEALLAQFYLADLFYIDKKYDEALELYLTLSVNRQSLEQRKQVTSYLRLGELCIFKKDYAKALNTYLTLLQLPIDKDLKIQVQAKAAEAAYEVNSYEQSIKLAQAGIKDADKTTSSYATLVVALGKAQEALGDTKKAIESYRLIEREISTAKGSEATVRRANLLLTDKSTSGDARKLMDRLIKEGSESPYWLARGIITLSDYYEKMNNPGTALQYLQSLQKNYTSPEEDIQQMISERLSRLNPKQDLSE